MFNHVGRTRRCACHTPLNRLAAKADSRKPFPGGIHRHDFTTEKMAGGKAAARQGASVRKTWMPARLAPAPGSQCGRHGSHFDAPTMGEAWSIARHNGAVGAGRSVSSRETP